MQEPRLANPALLVDDDAVHDGDLPGRAAEGERGYAQPDPERLAEGDAVPSRRGRWRGRWRGRRGGTRGGNRAAQGVPSGAGTRASLGGVQLWISCLVSRHQV